MRVKNYDYGALLAAVIERDGGLCFGRELLQARRQAQRDAWKAGQAEEGDTRNWVPLKLLECRLPWDAHHWLEKSWLKREFPEGGWALYPVGDADWIAPENEGGDWHWPLATILNDSRDASLCCRRHHDLIGNRLVVVRRGDLPEHVEEFAAELGTKAVARLERNFEIRTGAGVGS